MLQRNKIRQVNGIEIVLWQNFAKNITVARNIVAVARNR